MSAASEKQAEFRRYVKFVIAEELLGLLDAGWSLTDQAAEIGVSEKEIVEEIRRQAQIMYKRSL